MMIIAVQSCSCSYGLVYVGWHGGGRDWRLDIRSKVVELRTEPDPEVEASGWATAYRIFLEEGCLLYVLMMSKPRAKIAGYEGLGGSSLTLNLYFE